MFLNFQKKVSFFSVAYNGKYIAAGTRDQIVYLIDPITLQVIHKFDSLHTGNKHKYILVIN